MADDVRQRVAKVISQTLKIDASRVTDDARLVEDLGAESMQAVELIAAFEEEFDIEIDEDQALDVKTAGQAVAFIAARV